MNEYIKGCYKLKPGIYGYIVRNECRFSPEYPEYIEYCTIPGSDAVGPNVSEIISVSVTKGVNGPEVDEYVVTYRHRDGSIRSTEDYNNWH